MHLLEILEALPASIGCCLALPGDARNQNFSRKIDTVFEPARSRFVWEQSVLPGLIRRVKPDLVHLTTLRAPFLSSAPYVISPAEPFESAANGAASSSFLSRLGEALGRGGISRAQLVLWPGDLPEPVWPKGSIPIPLVRLPPVVHSNFYRPGAAPPDLPDHFIFLPGLVRDESLTHLASAWRWAGAGLGENYSLLLEGASPAQINALKALLGPSDNLPKLQSVCLPEPAARAAVVQRAEEVVCLGPVLPWGDPLLHAMACERPLVAVETPYSDARVGPAGYLAPPDDTRLLGAAMITPLVNESVQEQITTAARSRAAGWKSDRFAVELEKAYRRAINT